MRSEKSKPNIKAAEQVVEYYDPVDKTINNISGWITATEFVKPPPLLTLSTGPITEVKAYPDAKVPFTWLVTVDGFEYRMLHKVKPPVTSWVYHDPAIGIASYVTADWVPLVAHEYNDLDYIWHAKDIHGKPFDFYGGLFDDQGFFTPNLPFVFFYNAIKDLVSFEPWNMDWDHQYNGESESSSAEYGTSTEPPWVARGIKTPPFEYESSEEKAAQLCGIPRENLRPDLCTAMADFYLLGLIADGAWFGALPSHVADDTFDLIRSSARSELKQLVASIGPMFLNYFRMVTWGEARYHRALGNRDTFRSSAWVSASTMEAAIGKECYSDLAILFREFAGGSVGGEAWANIAEVVHARMTGKIDDYIFIDRAFHLQHNGGVAFNKLLWPIRNRMQWDMGYIKTLLGPAHHHNPPVIAPLYLVASDKTQRLWKDHIRAGNRAIRYTGQALRWDGITGVVEHFVNKSGELRFTPKYLPGTLSLTSRDYIKEPAKRTKAINNQFLVASRKREAKIRRGEASLRRKAAKVAEREEAKRLAMLERDEHNRELAWAENYSIEMEAV